jgi:hypothetical protein
MIDTPFAVTATGNLIFCKAAHYGWRGVCWINRCRLDRPAPQQDHSSLKEESHDGQND